MENLFLRAASYIGVFLGGLLTALSQNWLSDYFKLKTELRGKLERPYNLTSDIVAIGTKDGFTKIPTKTLFERAFKVAARLETLNKKNIANDLREFINKWNNYANTFAQLKKDPSQNTVENIEKQLKSRKELDSLSENILSAISEEYKIKILPERKIKKSKK